MFGKQSQSLFAAVELNKEMDGLLTLLRAIDAEVTAAYLVDQPKAQRLYSQGLEVIQVIRGHNINFHRLAAQA